MNRRSSKRTIRKTTRTSTGAISTTGQGRSECPLSATHDTGSPSTGGFVSLRRSVNAAEFRTLNGRRKPASTSTARATTARSSNPITTSKAKDRTDSLRPAPDEPRQHRAGRSGPPKTESRRRDIQRGQNKENERGDVQDQDEHAVSECENGAAVGLVKSRRVVLVSEREWVNKGAGSRVMGDAIGLHVFPMGDLEADQIFASVGLFGPLQSRLIMLLPHDAVD